MKLKNMNDAVNELDKLIEDLSYRDTTQSPTDVMDETALHLEVIRDWLDNNYE